MFLKPLRIIIYCLSIFFVVFTNTYPTHAQSLEGTQKALKFFENINNTWEDILMPLARRQAARDLRRLSNSLDDLALDKQEFTESLLAAYPDLGHENAKRINNSIKAFKDTINRLRRNLRKFTLNLPSRYQQEGYKVSQELFTGLSTKWQTLDEIAQWLTGNDTFSAEKIRTESANLVQMVLKLKAITDNLTAKISEAAQPT